MDDFDYRLDGIGRSCRVEALVTLANRQHGVVTLDQLRRLGWSDSAVRSRAARGELHRIHRGVFAVGRPTVSIEGAWLAAVMACGPGAVLSHRAAAALQELLARARGMIEVTSPVRNGRARRGIDAHYSRCLAPVDRTVVRGLPCTSVARTLLDLAGVVDGRTLERACDQSEVLRVFDLRAVEDVLRRAAGHPGAPALRSVLGAGAQPTLTRNELEERFLELCRDAGLPVPDVNADLVLSDGSAVEVDFLWRAQRLVVETDGWGVHGTRRAFERDRRRDQRLMVSGWRVVRFTWRQILDQPEEVVRTLTELLVLT